MLEREHLVPMICQLVPGTFISLIIGSLHSAAQFALEEIAAQYGGEICSKSQWQSRSYSGLSDCSGQSFHYPGSSKGF